MKKIRIGNDIAISWSVTVDNQPYYVEGKPLVLYISSGAGYRVRVEDFTASDNVVSFIFAGKDQIHAGIYSLTLFVNPDGDNMLSFDCCEAFQLVEWTCLAEETGASQITLEVGSNAAVSIVHPVIPVIGENGNWFIEGTDTGKPSAGLTAYDIAVLHGFEGTEEEWVAASTPMLAGISSVTAEAIIIADGTPPTAAVRKTPNGAMVDLHFLFGIPGNAQGGAPHLDLSTDTVSFSSGEDEEEVQVSSNLKWDVERTGLPEWLEVTPDQDIGDGTVTIKAKGNAGTDARSSVVTIKGHNGSVSTINCVQAGYVPFVNVIECPESVGAAGGEITITGEGNAPVLHVSAPGCTVTSVQIGSNEAMPFNDDEVTVDTNAGTGASYEFTLKVNVPANEDTEDSVRTVSVGMPDDSETLTVSQNGRTVKVLSTLESLPVTAAGGQVTDDIQILTMSGITSLSFRLEESLPTWVSVKIKFRLSKNGVSSYSEEMTPVLLASTYNIESGTVVNGYSIICTCGTNSNSLSSRTGTVRLGLWSPHRPEAEGAEIVHSIQQAAAPITRFSANVEVKNNAGLSLASRKCLISIENAITRKEWTLCNYTGSGIFLTGTSFDATYSDIATGSVGNVAFSTIEIDCGQGTGQLIDYDLKIANYSLQGTIPKGSKKASLGTSITLSSGSAISVTGTITIKQ